MKSISIIIATYNAEKYLQNCLNSIISQKNNAIEIIIIDGGSKDNTIQIIKKNQQNITYWISEPDKGIYDAWNKGISVSTSNWIMFLGADDKLTENALNKYQDFLSTNDNENLEYISSKMRIIDVNGKFIRIKGWPWNWPIILKETTIAHPGSLHSKRLFEKYGLYNLNYKIVGDTELLLRSKNNLKYAFMSDVTVEMQEGGVSDSVHAIIERYKATTITGGYPKHKAFLNACFIYIKYIGRKFFRFWGLNLYLKGA